MKYKRAAFFALLVLLIFPLQTFCAGAVPERVLDAREGIVRVYCETDGNVSGGTGFAVGQGSPIKYIVTSHDVVKDQGDITVLCENALSVDASVYIENENAGLCLLKLQTPLYDLQPLTIDDTGSAKAGDAVYALGFSPASDTMPGAVNAAVTDGIISALKSGVLAEDGAEVALMQTDAAFSSGGPLLNENGHVVGVNTKAEQDFGLAVSARALTGLLDAGGISYKSVSEEAAGDTWQTVLIAAVAVFFVLKRRRGAGVPRYTFSTFVADTSRTTEDKLSAILPLMTQVQKLHRQGHYHIDICPENITLPHSGALLRVKSVAMNSGGKITASPGYSAPERYSGSIQAGPWSDVYALSALLHTVLTGQMLAPAFERKDADISFCGIAEKWTALASVVAQGLSLEPAQRPPLDMLSVQIQACLTGYSPMPFSVKAADAQSARSVHISASERISVQSKPKKATSKKHGKKRTVVLCAAALVLVLGAGLLVTEVNYAQAAMHVEAGEYTEAGKSLKGVFGFYKDTQQLAVFTQAALKMENREYDAASRLFASLGEYRNAPDMVTETAYRHAQFNIENGLYTQAGELLAAVGDYRDAQDLRREIAYQNAHTYMEASMYLSALDALKAIGSYKDAADMIQKATAALYDAAVNALGAGETETAATYFGAIPGYEQADGYLSLCTVLTKTQSGERLSRDDYGEMLSCAESIDLKPYFMQDALIGYFLEGSWQDAQGNTFEMDSGGGVSSNLPWHDGNSYVIRDAVLYIVESSGTQTPLYGFTCVDLNTITIYVYQNEESYTLTRQR